MSSAIESVQAPRLDLFAALGLGSPAPPHEAHGSSVKTIAAACRKTRAGAAQGCHIRGPSPVKGEGQALVQAELAHDRTRRGRSPLNSCGAGRLPGARKDMNGVRSSSPQQLDRRANGKPIRQAFAAACSIPVDPYFVFSDMAQDLEDLHTGSTIARGAGKDALKAMASQSPEWTSFIVDLCLKRLGLSSIPGAVQGPWEPQTTPIGAALAGPTARPKSKPVDKPPGKFDTQRTPGLQGAGVSEVQAFKLVAGSCIASEDATYVQYPVKREHERDCHVTERQHPICENIDGSTTTCIPRLVSSDDLGCLHSIPHPPSYPAPAENELSKCKFGFGALVSTMLTRNVRGQNFGSEDGFGGGRLAAVAGVGLASRTSNEGEASVASIASSKAEADPKCKGEADPKTLSSVTALVQLMRTDTRHDAAAERGDGDATSVSTTSPQHPSLDSVDSFRPETPTRTSTATGLGEHAPHSSTASTCAGASDGCVDHSIARDHPEWLSTLNKLLQRVAPQDGPFVADADTSASDSPFVADADTSASTAKESDNENDSGHVPADAVSDDTSHTPVVDVVEADGLGVGLALRVLTKMLR